MFYNEFLLIIKLIKLKIITNLMSNSDLVE